MVLLKKSGIALTSLTFALAIFSGCSDDGSSNVVDELSIEEIDDSGDEESVDEDEAKSSSSKKKKSKSSSSAKDDGKSEDEAKSSSSKANEKSEDSEDVESSESARRMDCVSDSMDCIKSKLKKSGDEIFVLDVRDSNIYRTVYVKMDPANRTESIVWMAENLRYVDSKKKGVKVASDDDVFYTYDKAETSCPAGWRLANVREWIDVDDAKPQNLSFDENGYYLSDKLVKDDGAVYWQDFYHGEYWAYKSDADEKFANFSGGEFSKDVDDYLFHVRCVKEMNPEVAKRCDGLVLFDADDTEYSRLKKLKRKSLDTLDFYGFLDSSEHLEIFDAESWDGVCVEYRKSSINPKKLDFGLLYDGGFRGLYMTGKLNGSSSFTEVKFKDMKKESGFALSGVDKFFFPKNASINKVTITGVGKRDTIAEGTAPEIPDPVPTVDACDGPVLYERGALDSLYGYAHWEDDKANKLVRFAFGDGDYDISAWEGLCVTYSSTDPFTLSFSTATDENPSGASPWLTGADKDKSVKILLSDIEKTNCGEDKCGTLDKFVFHDVGFRDFATIKKITILNEDPNARFVWTEPVKESKTNEGQYKKVSSCDGPVLMEFDGVMQFFDPVRTIPKNPETDTTCIYFGHETHDISSWDGVCIMYKAETDFYIRATSDVTFSLFEAKSAFLPASKDYSFVEIPLSSFVKINQGAKNGEPLDDYVLNALEYPDGVIIDKVTILNPDPDARNVILNE